MIGMQAQIGSQMTADEALEYLDRVLARAGYGGAQILDPMGQQLRCRLIEVVVSTLGRPIAQAEIDAIKKAEKQFDEMRQDGALNQVRGAGRIPILAPDSPFLPPSGS